MSPKVSIELAMHRIEQAKNELNDAKLLYDNKSYLSANNRAYYSIFHSIRAVLALEPIDFKKHKAVLSYFNKNYIHTGIFPKDIGRRVVDASRVREDSDYDDEFIVEPETTEKQINTAEELISLIERYIGQKNNKE